MSRKHFEAIAASFASERANNPDAAPALDRVARDLCHAFAADNPRFNSARFLAACGVES